MVRLNCSIFDKLKISWRLGTIEDPHAYRQGLQVPLESGTFIYVDFLVRPEHQKNLPQILRTAESLRNVASGVLERELKKNPDFREISAAPAVESGSGQRVIRLAVVFSKRINVDSFLQRLGLPYLFSDIFTNFYGDVFSNVDIVDILSSPSKSFDDLVALKVALHCSYRKDIVTKILDRLQQGLSCGFTDAQIKFRAEKNIDEDYREEFRKAEALMQRFSGVVESIKSYLKRMQSIMMGSLTLEYQSVAELVLKLSFIPYVRKFIPVTLFSEEGTFLQYISTLVDGIGSFLTIMFNTFQKYLKVW